ncbi:MAG: hypothetical protein P9M14_11945 [Candidatus Alcyoniella australis]|nr:hypothetical protein [Candidatus Alcyoniella australis]
MGKTAAWYDEAQTLFVREGHSLAEISRRVGVSATTLSKWKAKGDWERLRKRYLASEKHFALGLAELKNKLLNLALADEDPDPQKVYALAKIMAASQPYTNRELKKLEEDEKEKRSPEQLKELLQETLQRYYGIDVV